MVVNGTEHPPADWNRRSWGSCNHVDSSFSFTPLLSQTNFLTSSLRKLAFYFSIYASQFGTRDCRAGLKKNTLTVSMLTVFSIKTRAGGKELSGRSQRFWPEI